MLTAGTRLGNYEILDMIGMGGMGAVYRARHSVLGRIDAVKVLAHHLTLQANFRQRFLHEAKIQAKLRHPNIAEVYDCFSSGDQYCISMEYVDGVPLNRLLCVGVLDESRLRKVFTQILDAMAFSHRQNVVHRDLKGSNLLITPQDEVKIVDFGIAKIIDDQVELTMSLDQLGTTRYMAPEQILNQTISPATDVYALGILLYESVTGHVPFEMFSDYEIKKAHVETKAADPREKAPYVSEPLARLIVDCIRKKPADRPQNAGSLEERFKQIAPLYTESPPVIAEHPTTIRSEGGIFDPHTVKLKKRDLLKKYAWPLAGLAAVLALAVLIGIVALNRAPDAKSAADTQDKTPEEAVAQAAGDISDNAITQEAAATAEGVREMTNDTSPETATSAAETPDPATADSVAAQPEPGKLLTLEDVIKYSETHTQEQIAGNLITVEASSDSWVNYPKNWRITYYTQSSATKRKTVVWENGELMRVILSPSPPMANNQKLVFSLDNLALGSDVIIEKANEYALEKGYQPERLRVVLEKSSEDSVSPSWVCELFNNRRRFMTLRFSAQTGEILAIK